MSSSEAKKLKTGFTTGAAAAAAVKGALLLLTGNKKKSTVTIDFIGGGSREIGLFSLEKKEEGVAVCTVIKDAGDDPDVTHRAEIGAKVTLVASDQYTLDITGGTGVGKVTKPGLEIPPGQFAINPGPLKMIETVVQDILANFGTFRVFVEIFVPKGEELAINTLNSRLGIIGGISILGTTGLVRPMSHDAYIATIRSSLSVAKACHARRVFFTTGRRSERFAQSVFPQDPEEAFIQIGDFYKLSVEAAANLAFEEIVLTVFFGKALKMAYGIPHTHAAKKDLCMKKLATWTKEVSADDQLISDLLSANTARQAFFRLQDQAPSVIGKVGEEMIRSAMHFSKGKVRIRSVIFDFDGVVCFDSHGVEKENR